MAISLANPAELWKRLRELFGEVVLVHQTDRTFTIDEYEALEPVLQNAVLCGAYAAAYAYAVENRIEKTYAV
jgi:hypothetical protein